MSPCREDSNNDALFAPLLAEGNTQGHKMALMRYAELYGLEDEMSTGWCSVLAFHSNEMIYRTAK